MSATTDRPTPPPGLTRSGVVAIARHLGPDRAPAIAIALASGGVGAFEITLNEPVDGALRTIDAVAREGTALDVGAGTVLSIDAAKAAIDCGATFLVMPHTDPDLIEWAAARGIPALPGAATPTEVLAGWRAGAAAVKVFPASSLSPSFIRELRGPFPDIPLVPTGGVTADTAGDFIAAGAMAVGLGSWLLGDGKLDGVTVRARRVVDAVAAARARS
jgi:2-dehydro-3-deoxyphosphogluconate aldolase/(4S)-4-hydroxy-2-oxoglutarate aldolase